MPETAENIAIHVNGKTREVPANLCVSQLVTHLGAQPDTTLVERNGVALFKREWPETRVEPGDQYEFVQIVAGG